MIKVIKGDLISMAKDGVLDVIGHGANCHHIMGAGIALQVKHVFPEAYWADAQTEKGDYGKLGDFSYAKVGNLTVANMYSQYYAGHYNGQAPIDYNALEKSLSLVFEKFGNVKYGFPLIGYGLAGGSLLPILDIFYNASIVKNNISNVNIVIFDKDPNANILLKHVEATFKLKESLIKNKL